MEEENILANCRVILEGMDNTYEGDSGPEGIISFQDIAEDTYTLTVQKEGYEDYVEEGIVINDQNKALRAKVSLKELPHQITILFMVTPEVKDVQISLINDEGFVVYHGITGEDGQLTLPHVEYGSYVVKAKLENYKRHTSNIKVNGSNNNPRTINIELEEQTTE